MRFSIFVELISEAISFYCCLTTARVELFATVILLFLKNEEDVTNEPGKLLLFDGS